MEQVSVGDIIAGLALLFSMYATWITHKFNNRQKALIESQEKLNRILLEKELTETSNDRKADLGASFVKLGSNKYRLKIWNKGKTTAKNVRISFPEGNEIIHDSDIEEKFPLEILEIYQSVELRAIVHMQTKSKHTILLKWSDEFAPENEKLVYPTL